MAKKMGPLYPGGKKFQRDYTDALARGSAVKASKPAEDRKAGPSAKGNQDWGGRGRPFTPGLTPSWDKTRN